MLLQLIPLIVIELITDEVDLTSLWELDRIGITKEDFTPNENKAQDLVIQSIEQFDTKYQVKLPFRNEDRPPTNFSVAKAQLDSLYKYTFSKDHMLLKDYTEVFKKYHSLDFIEPIELDPKEGHFLPHRPILKDSATTPVRAVFNASSRKKDTISLNGCLYPGPSLVTLLHDKLLEFRQGKYAAIADIVKAFHCILIHPEHRKYLKFLSYVDSRLQCWQFKVVPFGVTSSPYILQAVLKFHLLAQKTEFAQQLISKFYVDNLMITSNAHDDLIHQKRIIDQLLLGANMKLQGWTSSSIPFNQEFHIEEKVVQNLLGIPWNTDEDRLYVSIPDLSKFLDTHEITKRQLTFLVASI